jgi:hypothetical protein
MSNIVKIVAGGISDNTIRKECSDVGTDLKVCPRFS